MEILCWLEVGQATAACRAAPVRFPVSHKAGIQPEVFWSGRNNYRYEADTNRKNILIPKI